VHSHLSLQLFILGQHMKQIQRWLSLRCLTSLAAIAAFSAGIGCGLGDDDDDSRVRSVSIEDASLQVGGESVVRVRFEFSEDDIFGDNDEVQLAIRLPRSLRFRSGSAEVQGLFDDEDVSARVVGCSEDSTTLVFFSLDDDDLSGARNPSGDSDAELAFAVDAVAEQTEGFIEAKAQSDFIESSCGQVFLADAITSVTVG
jgi:hypothetical protein